MSYNSVAVQCASVRLLVMRCGPLQVSAYVTAAQIKFLLLHDGRNDEAIKGFFREVYDAYLRVSSYPQGSPFAIESGPACFRAD